MFGWFGSLRLLNCPGCQREAHSYNRCVNLPRLAVLLLWTDMVLSPSHLQAAVGGDVCDALRRRQLPPGSLLALHRPGLRHRGSARGGCQRGGNRGGARRRGHSRCKSLQVV